MHVNGSMVEEVEEVIVSVVLGDGGNYVHCAPVHEKADTIVVQRSSINHAVLTLRSSPHEGALLVKILVLEVHGCIRKRGVQGESPRAVVVEIAHAERGGCEGVLYVSVIDECDVGK